MEPLLFHPQGRLVRRARDTANLTSFGVHVRRHRQQRTGEWPQGTRWRHTDARAYVAMPHFGRTAVLAAHVLAILLVARGRPLTRVGHGRPRMLEVGPVAPRSTGLDVGGLGLRMVGVGLGLVLRVVIERLVTK
jgi:hypothetical protein